VNAFVKKKNQHLIRKREIDGYVPEHLSNEKICKILK